MIVMFPVHPLKFMAGILGMERVFSLPVDPVAVSVKSTAGDSLGFLGGLGYSTSSLCGLLRTSERAFCCSSDILL